VDSGNDARVTERDDIRLGVTLPPLAGIATAFLVRRGICAMTKAKPSAKGEAERSAPYAPHIHAQSVAYLLSSLRNAASGLAAAGVVAGTSAAVVPLPAALIAIVV
jgi:hypothetical protein